MYVAENRINPIILLILQLTIIQNLVGLGWTVTKINERTYNLTKRMSDEEIELFDLASFMNEIILCV